MAWVSKLKSNDIFESFFIFLNLYRNKTVDDNEQFCLCSQQASTDINANLFDLNSNSSIDSDHTVDTKPRKPRFRRRRGKKSNNKNNSNMKNEQGE
jgi:hypothetical protein